MKILMTGGTGFIGKPLKSQLVSDGHELFVLTRLKRSSSENLNYIHWNWNNPKDLTGLINQVDVVINLAGEPIADKRWTKKQKEVLIQSRVNPTRLIVSAINNAINKPKKLISASAVGIYGNRHDEEIIESSNIGNDFLATTCKEWESEAQKATTNVVILRIGLVLDKRGGVLKKTIPPFKFFVGGPLGSGEQWMSWIALYDAVELIKFAVDNDNVSGILNLTSPNPVTNKDFSRILGKALHRPSFMPAPAFILKLLLGEMSDLLLTGQKVIPQRAIQYGYKFRYPELEMALRKILDERYR